MKGGRIYYRLHATDPKTLKPWAPIHFGALGKTRFDPVGGLGTLYLASTLGGALMEVFDDRWGPVGSIERSLSHMEIREWWVTLVSLPPVLLWDATGIGPSKLGTDAQLLSGDHALSREWALRLMAHPDRIRGIWFPSRHDLRQKNVALFQRDPLFPVYLDPQLEEKNLLIWRRESIHRSHIVHGIPVQLAAFPGLMKNTP